MGMLWLGRALTAADIEELNGNPEAIWDALDGAEESPDVLDLDKAWHGLHWLLTGEAWGMEGPLAPAIMGGVPFGPDGAYGPPRLLTAEEVADLATALADVTTNDLRERFDAQAIAEDEVYPNIWDEPDVFDFDLAPHFEELKKFYTRAAEQNRSVLQVVK